MDIADIESLAVLQGDGHRERLRVFALFECDCIVNEKLKLLKRFMFTALPLLKVLILERLFQA